MRHASALRNVLFERGHLPLHEAVEHWHHKAGFSVPLAPDHAFIDELLPYGRHGSCVNAERRCDVSGLVRPPPISAIARKYFWDSMK